MTQRGLFSRGNTILRKFKNCTTDVKLKLFFAYCNNFYCSALWNNFKMSTIKHIHIGHNRIFKALLNIHGRCSISNLFVTHGVPNFTIIRRKLIYSLYKRIFSSQNSIVKSIRTTSHLVSCNLYSTWCVNLF